MSLDEFTNVVKRNRIYRHCQFIKGKDGVLYRLDDEWDGKNYTGSYWYWDARKDKPHNLGPGMSLSELHIIIKPVAEQQYLANGNPYKREVYFK